MKERPILFSAPMIQAILAGRKTQTRRLITPQPEAKEWSDWMECHNYAPTRVRRDGEEEPGPEIFGFANEEVGWKCPYGQPGERLWVRETWAIDQCGRRVSLDSAAWPEGWPLKRLRYPATDTAPATLKDGSPYWWNSRPSIHMPRWACRIELEVTGIRVEQLQCMSDADARAEGIEGPRDVGYQAFLCPGDSKPRYSRAVAAFEALWDSINGGNLRHGGSPWAWAQNPWVWVIDFKPIKSVNRAAPHIKEAVRAGA